MSKTDEVDDPDGGSCNSNDNGGVDGDDVFDTKVGDEANVAVDFAECNGNSKINMRVGVM